MKSMLLPNEWKTERLRVNDSTLDELPELQQINDAIPQLRGWMGLETQEGPADPMQEALAGDVLLPPNGRKELARLQSIRLRATDRPIGFLGAYHGFPDAETFWLVVLAIHPSYQRQGYGSELMAELSRLVAQLGPFARMQGYIWYENLPSLRFHVKAGFDRIVTIAENPSHAGEFHFLLEKSVSSRSLRA